MDIDSVGPSPSGASGVAGNPATAQSGAPTFVMAPLQLEIPGQDMMDVEPGFSGQFTSSAPANLASVAISSPSPAGLGTRATPPIGGVSPGCSSPSVPHAGVSISHLAQVSSQAFSAPGLDAAGVVGLRPVPTPPVAVVTKSDVHSSPYVASLPWLPANSFMGFEGIVLSILSNNDQILLFCCAAMVVLCATHYVCAVVSSNYTSCLFSGF